MTKTLITIASLLFIPACFAATQEQQIITIDGREVLLNEDGTWKYLSTDRIANTKDGTRIRLKEDGSWQAIGNAPSTSKKQVRTTDLDIKLQKVVIETFRNKSQKNTRIKTQTVFYIDLSNSLQAKNIININANDITHIDVTDNNGKNYPVLSLKSDTSKLAPSEKTTLVIRVEKSPSRWNSVKSIEITFKAGILGLKESASLSSRTIDFDKINVDGFK